MIRQVKNTARSTKSKYAYIGGLLLRLSMIQFLCLSLLQLPLNAQTLSRDAVSAVPAQVQGTTAILLGLSQINYCTGFEKLSIAENESLVLVNRGSTVTEVSRSEISLTLGKILVRSRLPLKISTDLADVYIRDNAMVLLEYRNNCLSVSNLYDLHRRSVQMVSDKNLIGTSAGERIVISRSMPTLNEVFDGGMLGLRDVHSLETASGKWITSCEYSLLDALKHDSILSGIRAMAATVPEKALLKPIEKTAAAIVIALQNHAAFFHLPKTAGIAAMAPSKTELN